MLVLTTTGRRSGLPRSVQLALPGRADGQLAGRRERDGPATGTPTGCSTCAPTRVRGPAARSRARGGCRRAHRRGARPPVARRGAHHPADAHLRAAHDAGHPRRPAGRAVSAGRGRHPRRARGARPLLHAWPAHARRRHPRLRGGDPRRLGRQRRAAHDRARPRRLAGPAAVGGQRLPAGPGLARARGRRARRPVRAAPGLPRRGRRGSSWRPRCAPLAQTPGAAHRAARVPGRRRRAAHARRAVADPGVVPPRGPGARRSAPGPGSRGWRRRSAR